MQGILDRRAGVGQPAQQWSFKLLGAPILMQWPLTCVCDTKAFESASCFVFEGDPGVGRAAGGGWVLSSGLHCGCWPLGAGADDGALAADSVGHPSPCGACRPRNFTHTHIHTTHTTHTPHTYTHIHHIQIQHTHPDPLYTILHTHSKHTSHTPL